MTRILIATALALLSTAGRADDPKPKGEPADKVLADGLATALERYMAAKEEHGLHSLLLGGAPPDLTKTNFNKAADVPKPAAAAPAACEVSDRMNVASAAATSAAPVRNFMWSVLPKR